MEDFRGIVFRDSPTGRRAALAGGPDVSELLATMKSCRARGEEAIAATAELFDLTGSQVRAVIRYDGAFPDEIGQRISLNATDVNEAEAARQREQTGLGREASPPRGGLDTYTRV